MIASDRVDLDWPPKLLAQQLMQFVWAGPVQLYVHAVFVGRNVEFPLPYVQVYRVAKQQPSVRHRVFDLLILSDLWIVFVNDCVNCDLIDDVLCCVNGDW